jgi:predicted RNA binding protein YcfA (HicA-like mRNA interferase family)
MFSKVSLLNLVSQHIFNRLTIRAARAMLILTRGEKLMTFRELEKIIINDGWKLKKVVGSHHQYVHDIRKGKITIPRHSGDIKMPIVNNILKQAGLK